MEHAVLKSIFAQNYASFADRVEFTCVADSSKKEHSLNTFMMGEQEINKVSYLYGANGTGKTYFCKIIREIQKIIKYSPLPMIKDKRIQMLLQNGELSNQIDGFAFDMKYNDEPTIFGIEIIIGKTTYHYEFSILRGKILSELLTKKHRRTEKLIERTSPDNSDIILKSELRELDNMKHIVRHEALCLPMASVLNNELANRIVEAIDSINVFNMASPQLDPARIELFSDENMKKYAAIIRKADPTIRKMNIVLSEEEINRQKAELDDFENRELIQTQIRVGVNTEHAVYNHGIETNEITTEIDFFNDESLGTVKLFTTLPYLFDVLENGGVLILDEIENGLHLNLVKDMISLFLSEESNPNHAQLICTTHQALLVSENVKRDQIWILTKDCVGKSKLQRLSGESSPRAKVNLTNKIIEGAMGCSPKHFFE